MLFLHRVAARGITGGVPVDAFTALIAPQLDDPSRSTVTRCWTSG
ncbi:hypothetical protein QF037_000236 [Streptomyces canus]|nr:hypothetical protein [Streptomyces canus]MDQ0595891.1 hypothetical protein [Streptomyces canus]